MQIKFWGTSHGYPEKGRFCSATLVRVGKKVYIIDAGAPIASLALAEDIELGDVNGIFVTHPHYDHTAGLLEYLYTFNYHNKYAQKPRTNIYLPTPFAFEGWLSLGKTIEMFFRRAKVHIYKNSGVIFDDGVAKVTAIPVKHCKHAHAFIFEADGKRILFSGDLCKGMRDYPEVLYKEHFDLLVLEAAHTLLDSQEVLDKVNNSKIDRLYINHISPTRNPTDVIASMFTKVKDGVDCKETFDGFEVEL